MDSELILEAYNGEKNQILKRIEDQMTVAILAYPVLTEVGKGKRIIYI